jgi:hypothetical protein
MPRKKKAKKVHHVTGTLNVVEFTKAGSALTLQVYDKDQLLGEITIGRGSFTWRGGRRRWFNEHSWSWTRFADLMNREAYDE